MNTIPILLCSICVATYPVVAALAGSSVNYTSPPVYPSPNTTGAGGWEGALSKANDFLSQLTLEEKLYLVTGVEGPCVGSIAPIPRLGFNGLCLQDGPLALRMADYASVFPAGLSAAASWDRSLNYQRAALMAEEFKAKGAHIFLGPVVGPLGRHALGGRNWEGYSPDPWLSGVLVNETIVALQNTGVQACVKHYIGNEQETQRNPTTVNGVRVEAVSSNIDDRIIHELYGWPFADAIKAGASSVMCSYNRVNSSYGCQNSKLLNGILKGELGFQGYVVSDWGATHAGTHAIDAGLDMDMPGGNDGFFGEALKPAISNGTLDESRLNDMVLRIMTPYFHLGQDNFPTVDPSSADLLGFDASGSDYQWVLNGTKHRDVRDDHADLIRQLGAASVTLLKNNNRALPITSPPKNIAVFGNDAADLTDGLYSLASFSSRRLQGWDIGNLYAGDGSGTGRLTYLISPLEAVKAWAHPARSLVQYLTNNAVVSGRIASIYPQPDLCLVFLKTYATEGRDRTSFAFDYEGNAVVGAVAQNCNNTVVVTHSAGVNTMPWADHPNVTAILAAHLPGQESGNSIMDVITGAVNPSGKLPYTIAFNESDYNAPIVNKTGTTDSSVWQATFTEGLMIDYRHFDSANITPRYEFGFGLSYTTFNISGLTIEAIGTNISSLPPTSASPTPGGNLALWETIATATVTVSNTGSVNGSTVPQLYVRFPPNTTPPDTPPQVLRGFDKVFLLPGESQSVTFSLRRRDLSYWNVWAQEWEIPEGSFAFYVGLSSRDRHVSGSVGLIPLG